MTNKVVVVTGAGSGIGQATALRRGGEGYRVVLAARRTDRLEDTAAKINADGGTAVARAVDVNIRGLLHGIAATVPHFKRQGRTLRHDRIHRGPRSGWDRRALLRKQDAARAITEGLRLESDPGIRVTTNYPGCRRIRTRGLDQRSHQQLGRIVLFGRHCARENGGMRRYWCAAVAADR